MRIEDLVQAALREDMPAGDVTTESLGLGPRRGFARLRAKQDLVLSGTEPFEIAMKLLEPGCRVTWHFDQGQMALRGQNLCTIEGDLMQILKAERVALNFVGHLSGIATLTRKFVNATAGFQCAILDTRKTIPGLRLLEKKAVLHGGGQNHRMNLSEAILIKDNHIAVAGGLRAAVEKVRARTSLPIEVECETIEQVKEAVSLRVQRILLDNMSTETLRAALALIPTSIQTEASGNMTLDRVAEVAATGVNFISVGALTHSAPAADVSLEFDWGTA